MKQSRISRPLAGLGVLALALLSPLALAQNPLHGHYEFISSELNYYDEPVSTSDFDVTTSKSLSGSTYSLEHSISGHLPFGAPGQSGFGSSIAKVGVKMKVK